MIDVREAVRAGGVVRLVDGVAEVGDFVGLEAIGDAHFVEIGVGGKRQQAGVLIFPAEAADPGLGGSLEDGNVEYLAANLVVVFLALVLSEINRSEEHTSELQSHSDLVCRLLLEKKKQTRTADIA